MYLRGLKELSYKIMNQKIEIQEEQKIINDTLKYIEYLNNAISKYELLYRNSFKKHIYLKYKNIGDLCDYRINLTCKIIDYNNVKDSYVNYLNVCNETIVKMYNNLLYLEILFNK